MEKDRVGEGIRKIRESMGLNQQQLADYLGIDQSTISKYEGGERSMSTVTLQKICNLFGCMPEELLDNEGARDERKIVTNAYGLTVPDLEAIAAIQRISMSIAQMKRALCVEPR